MTFAEGVQFYEFLGLNYTWLTTASVMRSCISSEYSASNVSAVSTASAATACSSDECFASTVSSLTSLEVAREDDYLWHYCYLLLSLEVVRGDHSTHLATN